MEVADGSEDFDLDKIDELVTRMLGHAFMAKAYGDALARDPQLIGGFGKLAARHRSAVEALSNEIGRAATALMGMGMVAAPTTVRERFNAR